MRLQLFAQSVRMHNSVMKDKTIPEKRDSDTKERLLKAAKNEFLEKGYQDASLRSICKSAGVTTGALYFFFKDKDDLFESLVRDVSEGLLSMLKEHFAGERKAFEEMKKSGKLPPRTEMADDVFAGKKIFHYLYSHYDEVNLLLKKSKGSLYENFTDQVVAITEKQNSLALGKYGKALVHWVSHMQINSFVHILTHVKSEKQASELLPYVMAYLQKGFFGLVDWDKK